MKTFFSDVIPKIQQFSKKLDDITTLQNQNWVSINELANLKTVYIFRESGQLLISENGLISKASWEYINSKTIMIDNGNESLLLNHGFLDEYVLALKLDGSDGYAFFINESKSTIELKSVANVNTFLNEKYIKKKVAEKKVGKFYYLDRGTLLEYGPFTAVEIVNKFKKGKISNTVYVRSANVPTYNEKLTLKDMMQNY